MPRLPDQTPSWLSYAALLAMLFGVLLFEPVLAASRTGRVVFDALFALMLLAGVWAAGKTPLTFRLGIGLAVPTLIVRGLVIMHPEGEVGALIGAAAFTALFCLYVAVVFASHVVRERHVGVNHIFGGSCAYILLGLMWASWYTAIELVHPGSFSGREAGATGFSDLTYFSFVTLTTLGYGDLSPVSPFARSTAVLEGIVGQLYVAILIARLVGVHTARSFDADGVP